MKKRRIGLWFLTLVMLLVGCSSNDMSVPDNAMEEGGGITETNEVQDSASQEESTNLLIGEKVITTIDMAYETLEYQNAVSQLKEIVEKHQAYIESSSETTNSYNGYSNSAESNLRQGSFSIRIPAEAVEEFLADLEGNLGTKVSEQIGNQDATKQYQDTQTRIDVLQRKEDRLLELLDQATAIEDILVIEDNLSETVAERELLQSQNDTIDELVDFSTLYLTISERSRISNQPGSSLPFWERAKEAIVDSAYTFYYWLQDAAIGLIYVLPYVIILALIALVIWRVRKSNWWKKKEAERATKKQQQSRYREKKKMMSKQKDKEEPKNKGSN
ncbi:DUF4349 domain-containing protein [Desemzia sp. RIT804]|uniref:DUF4349 domain-containing protein n=1 Tax=Desemzia sp. RIT 804 TaxID=2810209 RepID=UPI00194EE954|nr:DUF4349 domain-containing protein [Desemzia sp. RIT 804]MBM6615984.1 DUF4349 domain-containing protein [Desemzia sp. RIT 804]